MPTSSVPNLNPITCLRNSGRIKDCFKSHTIFLQIRHDFRHNCFPQKRQDGGMKTIILLSCILLAITLEGARPSKAAGPVDWVEQTVSPDTTAATAAQKHLRDAGPTGLVMLQERFAPQIAAHRRGAPSDEQWKKIAVALDKVGGQYDNYASGLYWYTDLEKAKAAARASGRPILSLRLLGRLDQDLSCANSRFFRTTLYPSEEINRLLKDRYILHWESFRPAPRVTIDFGDGRKLERTITGNSIHYVLNSDGQVIDALPGMYNASTFAAELRADADAMKEFGGSPAHLNAAQTRLLNLWASDLANLGIELPAARPWREAELEQRTNEHVWEQIAQLHETETAFDTHVRELMVRKFPTAQAAAPLAISKSAVEFPLLRNLNDSEGAPSTKSARVAPFPSAQVAAPIAVAKRSVEVSLIRSFVDQSRIASLRGTVSLDTVQNNYMRRTVILAFIAGPATQRRLSLTAINNWVYSQVFLTPAEDPWLGLAPPDVFSAIDNNGEVH